MCVCVCTRSENATPAVSLTALSCFTVDQQSEHREKEEEDKQRLDISTSPYPNQS